MQPLEEPYRAAEWCDTLNGKYVDTSGNKLSCSIPPFSYLYPTNSISPREGSAFVCTVEHNTGTPDRYFEDSLHGIAISQPITNSDTNYIGKFFRIPLLFFHLLCSTRFETMYLEVIGIGRSESHFLFQLNSWICLDSKTLSLNI